jgi:predicted CXXCH cytochrome family protein
MMIQRFLNGIMAGLLMSAVCVNAEETKPKKVSFYNDIRPVLQGQCHGCHQPAKAKGEYVMTTFEQLLKGGESGEKAVVPSKPDESHLVTLITPIDGEAEMPQ